MNQKGEFFWENFLEYLMAYSWALIVVIAIVVVCLVFFVNQEEIETEFWREEWECTKWQDTKVLINCQENITGTEFKDTVKNFRIIDCKEEFGRGWRNTGNDIWLEENYYITQCAKIITKTTCEHEQKCVEQKPRKCLITKVWLCEGLGEHTTCPLTETRQCDKEK